MDVERLKAAILGRITEDKRELEAVNKRLKRLPENDVVIRHRGHRQECYLITKDALTGKRIETYVPYNEGKKLLECYNRRYCLELGTVLEDEIGALERFVQEFDSERKYSLRSIVPKQLADQFQPVVLSQKEKCRNWADDDYKRNTFPLDEANSYPCEKGDVVRSRAECLAANILYNLGIDYRYECILFLDGRYYIFPDFTIMHPKTGEIWFIEIFGMMGKQEYALEAFRKINAYARSQYGDHVLFFFDYPGVPFDPDAFKALVQKIFLS